MNPQSSRHVKRDWQPTMQLRFKTVVYPSGERASRLQQLMIEPNTKEEEWYDVIEVIVTSKD